MEEVPSWSGTFWTAVNEDGSQVGVMSVHYDDTRLHKPPAGWKLTALVNNEEDECETSVYARA